MIFQVGYAIGAQNETRYKSIFRFSLVFAFCLSGVLTLCCYLGLEAIVGLFVSQPEAFDHGLAFSRVMISTSVLCSLLFVLSNALQGAGAATAAFILNVSRQGLVYIPALFLLGYLFGIDGLVYAQPVADVAAITLAVILYRKASKKFFVKEVI